MKRVHIVTALLASFLPAVGSLVLAQTSASFNLTSYVFGSGGRSASSANFRVTGTIGQAMVSQAPSTSAGFGVASGHWSRDSEQRIYLPAISRE